MLLDLIGGNIGSGKTWFSAELMRRTLKKNPQDRCIMLVPDQLSYTAEKTIAELLDGTGPNGVEVMTLSRFVFRVLNPDPERYLTPSGKQMLIHQAVTGQKDREHRIFEGCLHQDGFLEKVHTLLAEMSRYCISAELLKKNAEMAENGMLREKLLAFSDIMERYEALTEGRFLDSADDFLRLAEKIEREDILQNTHIWFDGFSDFSPSHYAVLRAMLRHAASVHVTLCMPRGAEEDSVFSPVVQTKKKLTALADELGVRVVEQWTDAQNRRLAAQELAVLAEHWGKRYCYTGECERISLYQARDRYGEVDRLAREILACVQGGARYRDICVICGAEENYRHIIEAVFADYGIPYFSDSKIPITEHPVIVTVLSVFALQKSGWSYEAMFSYLRCGFFYYEEAGEVCPFPRDWIDRLENYVLRHGIRGKKAWCGTWEEQQAGIFSDVLEDEEREEDLEELNRIRAMITEPLETFFEEIAGKKTVRQTAEALIGFFGRIHLYEGLRAEICRFEERGLLNEAEQFRKIWNLLLAVIDQTVVTGGELPKSEFADLLRVGLAAETISIIPSGIDRVTVGSLERNSFPPVRHAYFLGCLEGDMPKQPEGGGILTDADRAVLEKTLAEDGKELAKESAKQVPGEEWKLYRAVFSASESLHFFWPTLDQEGNACRAAGFLEELVGMFPNMRREDHLAENGEEVFYSEKHAFSGMMRQMAMPDRTKKDAWNRFYRTCKEDPTWAERLELCAWASAYKRIQPKLLRAEAERLYRNSHTYSTSRLSVFRSCPFSYYIKHGMQAEEREIRKIHKFDLGRLLHWAVCRYCESVNAGETELSKIRERWCALSEEESRTLVRSIMSEIEERVGRTLRMGREKVFYLLSRMEKTMNRSVEVIRMSMTRGSYAAVALELDFRLEIEWQGKQVGIRGTIDRVDLDEFPEEETAHLRIVDYKSGGKEFSIADISNQTDMQLVLYAIAALKLYESGVIAGSRYRPEISGVLYQKLRDDLEECPQDKEDRAEALARRSMRMDGLIVLKDEEDLAEAVEMDHSLENGYESEFLKLGIRSNRKQISKTATSYTTTDRFSMLMDYVKKSVIALDEQIYQGEIRICPAVQGNKTPCSYCAYREICLYDPVRDGKNVLPQGEEAAWEKIEAEVGEEEDHE